MEEAQEFLDTWINNTENETIKNEYKEYSEREVVEMLKEYKDKFSLSGVVKSLKYYKKIPFEEYEKLHNIEKTKHGIRLKDGKYMHLREFLAFKEEYYKL